MPRTVTLSGGKAGISRQRFKGGASPEALYDGVNCYRTASQTFLPRPGTARLHAIPGTKGLCVHEGKYVVFAGAPTASPSPDVVVEVLTHPDGAAATLVDVAYAKPFLGFIYVVASWSDAPSVYYHYWLQRFSSGRKVSGFFKPGTMVQPTTPNGFGYVADRFGSPPPRWTSGQVKAVGDRIDPPVFAGYVFEVEDVFGTNPTTGTIEPDWNAIVETANAVIIEEAGSAPVGVSDPTITPQGPAINPDIGDRYGNMAGFNREAP
jgi:hypothetical protein